MANNLRDEKDLAFIEKEAGIRPVAAFYTSEKVRSAERNGLPIIEAGGHFSRTAAELVKKLEEINGQQ